MFSWYSAVWLLAVQADKVPGTNQVGEAGANSAPADTGMFSSLLMFLPMMLAIMLVYMLIMQRPQQKDQARMKEMLADLKVNDKVLLAGGILGTIANINAESEYLTVRIDEKTNAKLQVLKQSVIRVIKDKADDSAESKK